MTTQVHHLTVSLELRGRLTDILDAATLATQSGMAVTVNAVPGDAPRLEAEIDLTSAQAALNALRGVEKLLVEATGAEPPAH